MDKTDQVTQTPQPGAIVRVVTRPVVFDLGATVATIQAVDYGKREDYNDREKLNDSFIFKFSDKDGVTQEYETGTKLSSGGTLQSGLSKILSATNSLDAENIQEVVGKKLQVLVTMAPNRTGELSKKIEGFAPAN